MRHTMLYAMCDLRYIILRNIDYILYPERAVVLCSSHCGEALSNFDLEEFLRRQEFSEDRRQKSEVVANA